MKKVLICLHGLMNHDDHDIHYFTDYITPSLKKDEEVRLAYLYSHADYKTYNHKCQIKALDALINEYFTKGYEVSIMGYSYSNSLVAKMARKYNFHKVVLVSPTYKFFGMNMISDYIKVIRKTHKLKRKYKNNPKAKAKMKQANLNHVVNLVLNVYKLMISNKKNFKFIKAPCLMYRGTADNLVTISSFAKCVKSVKSSYKDVRIYSDFSHTFIRHEEDCSVTTSAWNDIYNFCFND